jgi:hypothetical protein
MKISNFLLVLIDYSRQVTFPIFRRLNIIRFQGSHAHGCWHAGNLLSWRAIYCRKATRKPSQTDTAVHFHHGPSINTTEQLRNGTLAPQNSSPVRPHCAHSPGMVGLGHAAQPVDLQALASSPQGQFNDCRGARPACPVPADLLTLPALYKDATGNANRATWTFLNEVSVASKHHPGRP